MDGQWGEEQAQGREQELADKRSKDTRLGLKIGSSSGSKSGEAGTSMISDYCEP